MSGWEGNEEKPSAQGSFLDFRPATEENEPKPPTGVGIGQVNESFGKVIM